MAEPSRKKTAFLIFERSVIINKVNIHIPIYTEKERERESAKSPNKKKSWRNFSSGTPSPFLDARI